MIVLLFVLLACGPRHGPVSTDPAAVLQLQRERELPFALQARFSVHVQTPGMQGTTTGAMIVHRPDQFRIEINSPVGTPLIIVASDGRSVNAWSQQQQVFYQGSDARTVLDELSAGTVGLSDVVALLTGGLPQAEVLESSLAEDGEHVSLVLAGPEGQHVGATLDGRSGLVEGFEVGPAGGPATLSLRYGDVVRVGRSRLPGSMALSAPGLGISVEIEARSWDELGQIPNVFQLSPPPGVDVVPLDEALRSMRQAAP